MSEIKLSKYNHFGKKINIALIFPDKYKFGIANLGHQTVYRLFNETQIFNCERFYADNDDLRVCETRRFITDFSVLAFSVCYELQLLYILRLLNKLNYLPLTKYSTNKRPLILIAGALTFVNADILYDFADLVYVGDLENKINNVCNDIEKIIENRRDSDDLIIEFNNKYKSINNSNIIEAYSLIVSDTSEFPNTALIELTRGCANNCAFCNTGAMRKQVRITAADIVENYIEILKDNNIRKIGFIGSAVLAYPQLLNLLENLLTYNFEFSFSSINLNHLTKDIIECLVKSGQNTITLAPEAGNSKMLKILNKNIDFDKLFELIKFSVERGIKRLKLYFIYGLAEETEEDLDDIVNLVKQIKDISQISNKPFNLIVSLNPLIPKPNTAFSKREILRKNILLQKQNYLKKKIFALGARLECLSISEAIKQYQIAHYGINAITDFL